MIYKLWICAGCWGEYSVFPFMDQKRGECEACGFQKSLGMVPAIIVPKKAKPPSVKLIKDDTSSE